MVNQLGPFQSYIYSKQFNIITLTETLCDPDISDREILPENYTVYRNDRDSWGGGVLLAISDTICSEQIESPTHSECLLVKLHTHKPIILCVVYVPPSPDPAYLLILLDYIRQFASWSENFVLGDFNCPDVNWAFLTAASSPSRLLCDFVLDYDMCQLVESPTHEKGNILYLLLVYYPDCVSNLTVHTDWSVFPISSRHCPLTSTLPSKANLTNYSSSMNFQFHKGNYVLFIGC
uniref:Endonuclease/exonuclease/phosphatase domain-containing protein n=1 Tax=Amphimedon queenslandica TaxID=400682 RepID=A0A1X7TMI5_AMPQE